MNKVNYLLNRAIHMDTGKFIQQAKLTAKKYNTNTMRIFLDMIFCAARYGAGFSDYSLFEFPDRTAAQRSTYLTRQKNNKMVVKYNQKDSRIKLDDKRKFNSLFSGFLGRDWLDLSKSGEDKAVDWINAHETFFAKMPESMCGKGVIKIKGRDYYSALEIYDKLISEKYFVVEDEIHQADIISALNPSCVNSIRVVTLYCNNKVHILSAYLRIGNGKFVDNLNSGGMASHVDTATGKVLFSAADKDGNIYEVHPQTGVKIKDFCIPCWEEVISMVQNAAIVVPQVAYVGWDVAITDKGPVLIEANAYPGHDISQLPSQTPDKTGFLPVILAAEKL